MKKILLLGACLIFAINYANSKENYSIQGTFQSPAPTVKYNTQFGNQGADYIKIPVQERQFLPKSDPYCLKINGIKYYFVINNAANKYEVSNILGYNDDHHNLFDSLLALESDNNKSNITGKELAKANIRLVALQPNGKLAIYDKSKDFNINNVVKIDTKNIRETINNGSVGTFGYFDVYIKSSEGKTKKIIGQVTFEKEEELKKLL